MNARRPPAGATRTLLRASALGLLLLLAALPAAAELTATLSRGSLAAGQTVLLTLIQTGPTTTGPDLTPLERDFHIVGRASSSQVNVINGQRQESRELRLTLLPRHSGQLAIPPITAGDDSTRPLTLTVGAATNESSRLLPPPAGVKPPPAAAPPPDDVTVHAEVSPHRVRVGEQVLLTVEVSSGEGAPRGLLYPPRADRARVLALGEDRRIEDGGGGERQVYERRYALFPTSAGTLTIEPLRYEAWDPAAGEPSSSQSAALSVQVERPPAVPDDRTWLPAASLTLTEAGPSEVRLAPGQALERTITLKAEGLMAGDLPAIPLDIPFQLRVHDDPPRLWNERTPDGVVGYRLERILISAAEPGHYVLSSPGLPWWNTRAGQWETATLPDWTLTVATLDSSTRRLAPTWTPPSAEPATPAVPPKEAKPPAPARTSHGIGAGPWIATAGAVLIIALLLWWWRWWRRRREPPAPFGAEYAPKAPAPAAEAEAEAEVTADPMAQAIDAVAAAYDTGNPTRARAALLAWAALVWPADAPGNLARLALRLPEPLRGRITRLEKAFFSPTPVDWTDEPVAPLLAAVAEGQAKPSGAETSDQS